ncbi:MAG: hypothetical protein ACLS49_00530 [Christensenellales bacterium]
MKKKGLKTIKKRLAAVLLVFMLMCSTVFGETRVCVKAAELPDWAIALGFDEYTATYNEASDTLLIDWIHLTVDEPEKLKAINEDNSTNRDTAGDSSANRGTTVFIYAL